MEAPHSLDAPDSDFVVVGFPYEGIRARDTRVAIEPGVPLVNTPYARDGAWEAPDAIRRNSLHYAMSHGPGLQHYEMGSDFRIGDSITVSDAGNLLVSMQGPSEPVVLRAADDLLGIISEQRIPLLLGGDDIAPYVGLSAVARQRKGRIAVLKFDAHFDLAWEPRYWAGSAWARAMEAGILDPSNLGIVGIRGLRNTSAYGAVARELGIHYCTITDVDHFGIEHCVKEALMKISKNADFLYVSFDVDVMDPAYLPAQKYPEPAGMTAREAIKGIRTAIAHGPQFCGFDLTCLSPRYDVNGAGCQMAARLVVEAMAGHGFKGRV
jgi:arginase family enzyme